jgi:hypothetical protein
LGYRVILHNLFISIYLKYGNKNNNFIGLLGFIGIYRDLSGFIGIIVLKYQNL